MKIFYHPQFNIDFGIFNRLHPFDGVKFRRVYEQIKDLPGIEIVQPTQAIELETLKKHVNELMQFKLSMKGHILQALELPDIRLIPFSLIDRKILLPMRWGVAATLEAARLALQGHYCWNLSGGYHHASHASCEGFCVYNDIMTSIKELRADATLAQDARILIIDVDVHHGNGNALAFLDDTSVTILDQYNRDIYPHGKYSRRVNINLPLADGSMGPEYLASLDGGLARLRELVARDGNFVLAFVVAGTDVLAQDSLGNFGLTVQECIQRDTNILETLRSLGIPSVFVGGGGYSKESAEAIAGSIRQLYQY